MSRSAFQSIKRFIPKIFMCTVVCRKQTSRQLPTLHHFRESNIFNWHVKWCSLAFANAEKRINSAINCGYNIYTLVVAPLRATDTVDLLNYLNYRWCSCCARTPSVPSISLFFFFRQTEMISLILELPSESAFIIYSFIIHFRYDADDAG